MSATTLTKPIRAPLGAYFCCFMQVLVFAVCCFAASAASAVVHSLGAFDAATVDLPGYAVQFVNGDAVRPDVCVC